METAFRSFPTRPNFDFKTWSVTQSQKGLLTKRDKKGGEARNARLFLDCLYGEGVRCWASRDCVRGAVYVGEHRIDGG